MSVGLRSVRETPQNTLKSPQTTLRMGVVVGGGVDRVRVR